MKTWTNTEFIGHNPVGTAAVVIAPSAEEAAALLNKELVAIGLKPTATAEQMRKVSQTKAVAVVLRDGDY